MLSLSSLSLDLTPLRPLFLKKKKNGKTNNLDWDKCKPGANGSGGKNCGPDAAFVNDNWLGHCENVYTGRYP